MNQEKSNIEELVAKVAAGEASESEKEIVGRWLLSLDMPDNSPLPEELSLAKKVMLEAILAKASVPAPGENPTGKFRKIWRLTAAAAAVLIAIVLGRFLLTSYITQRESQAALANSIIIHSDSAAKFIRLPDGSGVWMNARSSMSYNAAVFSTRERKITLQGEAYFDVASDPAKPFIVSSGSIDTRVLGTGFNVQTYQRDKTIKITLVHGSIAVNDNSSGKTTMLKPHQQLKYNKENQNWKIEAFNRNPAQNWMNGDLSFHDVLLSEAIEDIGHRYNVIIEYDSHLLRQKKVTMDIREHDKIESVLNSILFIYRLHYTVQGDHIHIY